MSARAKTFEEQKSTIQNLTFDHLGKRFDEISITLTEESLELLNIRNKHGYTQLGFILSDQCDQSIKVASFRDEYRMDVIERDEFTGCVLKQMDEALAFISRYNRTSSVIKGIYREDKREFSETSIREAMANAIIHRDYSLDDPILVSIYPKRITITSPGGMRRPYTIDELIRGVSSLRNRGLASIFYRLRLIEAYGTGIPRIFGAYDGLQVKPTIETGSSSFTITLPAEDDNDDKIESFLKDRNEFTRQTMEEELGLKRSTAVSIIKGLVERGTITKIGDGRSIRYLVNRR